MSKKLQPEIDRICEETESVFGDHHRRLIAHVEQIGQRAYRPEPGDPAPDFAIPDADGKLMTLSKLLSGNNGLCLVFVRGLWCPYCTAQTSALANASAAFEDAGIRLAIVTPEVRGRAIEMKTGLGLDCDVLCDIDLGVALAYGLLVQVAVQDHDLLRSFDADLAALYDNAGWFMPLATTFIVGPDHIVRDVIGEADQRVRPEPEEVLQRAVSRLPP